MSAMSDVFKLSTPPQFDSGRAISALLDDVDKMVKSSASATISSRFEPMSTARLNDFGGRKLESEMVGQWCPHYLLPERYISLEKVSRSVDPRMLPYRGYSETFFRPIAVRGPDDTERRLRELEAHPHGSAYRQEAKAVWTLISQVPGSIMAPFILLERARRLLSQERTQDARELLECGSANHPDDEQIADLLCAISPGRVRNRTGTTVDRKREMLWIRKYGRDYRGQWVALQGDRLVASADELKSLIEKVGDLNNLKDPPLIQRVVQE